MTLERRIKQREFAFSLGIILTGAGFVTFISVSILVVIDINLHWAPEMFLKWVNEILMISMAVLGYGALLIVFGSRLGWNKSILIDISLNQFGVLFTTIAYVCLCIQLLQDTAKQASLPPIIMVIFGLLLISLGIKYSTYD